MKKDIPLLKPIFFEETDPRNPKYMSLKEKQNKLEKLERQQYNQQKKYTAIYYVLLFIADIVAPIYRFKQVLYCI